MPEGGGTTAVPSIAIARETVVGPASGAAWRRAGLVFALALAALFAIHFETVADLVDGWSRSGTFAHGYIIFPVSAWLVWRRRETLALFVPRAQPLAALPLLACGIVWLTGHTAEVHAPAQYAFVAMVPCVVWGVFGSAITRQILFPLAFLFFAVPAGDFLMPTLMDHTADFTVLALRLSGVPVFREGNYFSIPSGNWSVVEACSGLRYLIASLTLGCLFAYLNYRSAWRRAAFIVASLLVPIVANWLRAYMIVMIAHLSSNALATGVDHLIYGWLFFGLVMLTLFWVGNFWREDEATAKDTAAAAHEAARAAPARFAHGIAVALAAMFVAIAPWPALASWLERVADAAHPGAFAIDGIPGWQRVATDGASAFQPHYQRPRSTASETFASGDRQVDLFVAYYSGQAAHGALVTYDNDVVVVTDKVWGRTAERARVARTDDGRMRDVIETEIKGETPGGGERLVAWRWYWINGRLTTSNYLAKAWTAFDKLTGRGDDSAVIVVSAARVGGDAAPAADAIAAFVAAAAPTIDVRLEAVRNEARK